MGSGGAPATTTSTTTASTGSTTTSSQSTQAGPTSTGSGGSDCGNGRPDDGEECDDGGTAPEDGCSPTCTFEGTSCEAPISAAISFGQTLVFATTTAQGAATPGGCGVENSPGRHIRVTPQEDGYLTAWIRRDGTDFDSVLRLMDATCQGLHYCTDAVNPGDSTGGENVTVEVQSGEPLTVVVSGPSAAEVGTFTVEITLDEGTCGDPVEIHLEPSNGGSASASLELAASGSQQSGLCGGSGEEVVFRVTPMGVTSVIMESEPHFGADAVVYARSSCGTAGSQLACADAGGADFDETIDVAIGGPTYFFADCDVAGDTSVRFTGD